MPSSTVDEYFYKMFLVVFLIFILVGSGETKVRHTVTCKILKIHNKVNVQTDPRLEQQYCFCFWYSSWSNFKNCRLWFGSIFSLFLFQVKTVVNFRQASKLLLDKKCTNPCFSSRFLPCISNTTSALGWQNVDVKGRHFFTFFGQYFC